YFTDPPSPELSTLSLHDALPISALLTTLPVPARATPYRLTAADRTEITALARNFFETTRDGSVAGTAAVFPNVSEFAAIFVPARDRKSTRLNSSHLGISYAVFCL